MRLTQIVPRFAGVVVGLFSLGAAGCINQRSNGTTLIGRSDPPARPGAVLGQPQPDAKSESIVQRLRNKPSSVQLEEPTELSSDKRSQVYLALGQMLESVGKLGDAQQQYEQASKADSGCLKAKLALARVHTRLGRPDAAMRVYEQAEKKHRKNPAVYNDKGLLLADQKEWAKAIPVLRKAVQLDPSNTKYHNNLGMVLAASGKYDEAWGEFREAVGAGPAHYNVALMLVRSGRTAQARPHLVQALATMPGLKEANTLLTQINSSAPDAVSQTRPAVTQVEPEKTLVTAGHEEPPQTSNTKTEELNTKAPVPLAHTTPAAAPTDDGTELVPVIYEEESPASGVQTGTYTQNIR